MGGNALKNTVTRRYDAAEYQAMVPAVRTRLYDIINVWCAEDIKTYRNKPSFGDMDILYITFDGKPLDVDAVNKAFSPNETVRNTNVISFNYQELQVDLIHTTDEFYEYGKRYFQYSDMGNLIGRIAHQFGLKHGHAGLRYPIREADQVFAEIQISLDHNKTLEFLDLDAEHYEYKGFDELEDIFKFVTASKYFNPEFYKLENLNAVGRIRDRKRSTYNSFLQYCDGLSGDFWKPEDDNMKYLDHIFDFFPEAWPNYQTTLNEVAALRYVRTKFNGTLVSELTGLTEKMLGMFMKHLRSQFWFKQEVLIHQPQSMINEKILDELNNFIVKQ